MFRQSLWNEFEQKVRNKFDAGKTVLVVTDIVGFFEHIDLNILKDMLIRFRVTKRLLIAFMKYSSHGNVGSI